MSEVDGGGDRTVLDGGGNRTKRIAAVGVRVVGGLVVAAATVAAVVVAVLVGAPGHAATPVVVTMPPAASPTLLACDGPLLAIGRDAGAAQQVVVAADQSVTTAAAPGTSISGEAALAAPGLADGAGGPVVVTAPPVGRSPARVAAAGSASVSAPDLAGFAASGCRPALMQSWLVGGASTTGASDLIVLSNPGAVAATVQLTVYGPDGPLLPPGASGIVVAPHTQRILPLAGLEIGATSPVIRVVASGAPVQASLQTSIMRTLVPGGVDQVGAIATAGATQVIPGLQVQQATSADSAPTTVVRVMATAGDTSATIRVSEAGSSGAGRDAAPPRTVALTAGRPVEVELAGLSAGAYTVTVSAATQVVAAVWHTTGLGAGSDFAWYTSAPALRAPTPFAVPSSAALHGPSATIAIANSGATPVTVTVTPIGGTAPRSLALAPGASATLPVTAGQGYLLDPGGSAVSAAVSFAGEGALASFPVWASDAASAPVTVYP